MKKLFFQDLPLKLKDKAMYELLMQESQRQYEGIQLIASENFIYQDAGQLLGSCIQNKYAEGYPGARYYGGCEVVDKIESTCQDRLLKAFRLDSDQWKVNVQPLSGSPANFALYTAILQPGEKMMGMALSSGGHLTHGFYSENKKISKTSLFWQSKQYPVNDQGFLDYDLIHSMAKEWQPKLLLSGFSCYPRDIDHKIMRQIADDVGAFYHCDMAHISGLVAGQVVNNPFEYADFVTSTTHKTLRGPRSGLIFSKVKYAQQVDETLFPGLQGGPHEHQIAALATTINDVLKPEWAQYCHQILKNSRALAQALQQQGFKIVTDGTDNHIVIWNINNTGLTATKIDAILSYLNIGVNKNTIVGDKSAINPSGIRIGSCSVTTRGYDEKDCRDVVEFLYKAVQIGLIVQKQSGKKLIDFIKAFKTDQKVQKLKEEVRIFARGFDIPGINLEELKEWQQCKIQGKQSGVEIENQLKGNINQA